jgi:hypothetical protein
MAKDHDAPREQGRKAARDEKQEFREKGGAAVGVKDSVVEGHLAGIAGNTQDTYGGQPKDVRPKLDEAAKRKPDSSGR